MSTKQLAHSPKGASSAERWMNCPGSITMLDTLKLPPSDESDFAIEGTNAHEAAAFCLKKNIDAWELIGPFQGVREFEVTPDMADAVQVYIDVVRGLVQEGGPTATHLIEERISGDFDPDFYGTVDDAIVGPEVLDVTDFKYGVGIAVDANQNPQLMYYAVGILERCIGPTRVRLRIVQPRAFHPDGPVRVWETTSSELLAWKKETLVPAMALAGVDHTLTPGEWCRFCPAKLACPMLNALFGAMATIDPKTIVDMSDEALGRNYALLTPAKIYEKALADEAFKRLHAGKAILGAKLVAKKADRVFKDGAEQTLRVELGPDAYTKPELKSPAQIDALGAKGKLLTKQWAYSPQTGLTVAPENDKRAAVTVRSAAETFSGFAGGDNGST